MINKLFAQIAYQLNKRRNKKNYNKLYQKILSFLQRADNVNFDPKKNGEYYVLNKLNNQQYQVFFDVGANIGEWSNYVNTIFQNSTIHCFEIVPSTYALLQKHTEKIDNIKLNPFGLSDYTGELEINIGKGSEVSSAFKIKGMKNHENFYTDKISCPVITGEKYMIDNEINEVDFLKIDTEGNDLRVIKGFKESLSKVKVIQFEYGIFNIASRDLLIDFYTYLEKNEFVVGKIYPTHIDFSPYHFHKENFHGGNFLAINKNYDDIIDLFNN